MRVHTTSETPQRPPIDQSQLKRFLRVLDPSGKWFTVQLFTDGEQKPTPDPLAKVFNISRFTPGVLELYAQGAGVWVTVNDTEGNGRKGSAVTRIRAVWQEDDDGFEGEFPLEPSLVVETSPGHFHRYWLVDDAWPADEQGRKDFAGVMVRMVASYGSDKGAKDISRVLRVPGFLHRKNPAEPHMVRMVGGNHLRYPRGQILEAFPPVEKKARSDRAGNSQGNGYDGDSESHAELVRQVLTGENYHSALTSLAWRYIGSGMHAGQIVEHLRGIMLSIPEESRDERWRARYAEIPRLVSSAGEKRHEARTNGHAPGSAPGLMTKRGSSVTMERIDWLWPGRIARGKHTGFGGEPGIGKSQLLLWTAARISTGGAWPCGEGTAPKGSVVLLSSEDGVEDTILPRFKAAGGDPEKLHIITAVKDDKGIRTFNLQADLAQLEAKIQEIGDVALAIIDPISSYMGKGADSHKNTETRGVIEPLSEMGARMRVAILSNTHFSKAGASSKSRALHRFIGSIAFVGAPRAMFAVVEDSEDKTRRLLLHAKNNIAPAAQGLAYTLEQALAGYIGDPPEPLYASRVVWDAAPVSKTADQALAEHEAHLRGEARGRPAPERSEAEAFLRELLASGPQTAKDVTKAAREAGISDKPLRQARERLCDSSPKRSKDGKVITAFMWSLKEGDTTTGSDD